MNIFWAWQFKKFGLVDLQNVMILRFWLFTFIIIMTDFRL